MIATIKKVFQSLAVLLFATLFFGGVYTGVTTFVAQILFPNQARGSLLTTPQGKILGSRNVAQIFESQKFFTGRPSALSAESRYSGLSGADHSNPANPDLLKKVSLRVDKLRNENPGSLDRPIPADLVTTSASGLDPDISPASAFFQVPRIAAAWGVPDEVIVNLVLGNIKKPPLAFLGPPTVNVLELNLETQRVLTKAENNE